MKTPFVRSALLVAGLTLLLPATAFAGGLDDFIKELDIQASVNLSTYKSDLSATFHVSNGKVDAMLEFMSPSDVYMCLRIGELTRQPIDRVIGEFKSNKGQGWGVIAKNMGIQPGSAEFHALKEGRLPSGNRAAAGSGGNAANNGKGGKGKK